MPLIALFEQPMSPEDYYEPPQEEYNNLAEMNQVDVCYHHCRH